MIKLLTRSSGKVAAWVFIVWRKCGEKSEQ